ncbi:YbfB/YjiJ family MFS transporter [Escherichia coli]
MIFVWCISPAVARLRPFLLVLPWRAGCRSDGMVAAIYSGVIDSLPGGVASAGMWIFGSTLIMQHTRHPFVLAALFFLALGIGIALGNEICSGRPGFCLILATRYGKVPALFWHDAFHCTYAFNALEKHAIAPMPFGKNGATDNELVVTGYSVRLVDLVISSSRLTCRSWRKMQADHC